MTTLFRNVCALAALVILLASASAFAQQPTLKEVLKGTAKPEATAEPPAEEPAKKSAPAPTSPTGPVDDLNRGVPRSSVEGFLVAARKGDWEGAAEYLDLRNLPQGLGPSDGPELARDLIVILDRALWIDFATLSNRPEGHTDDGLPSYRDRVGVISTPERKIEVLLQRVPRGDGVFIWKFSNRSVKEIPTLYEHHGYSPVAERLRNTVPHVLILGLQAWQWVGMITLGLVSYLLAWVLTAFLAWGLGWKNTASTERLARFFTGPVRFLLFVIVLRQGVELLAPSLVLRAVLDTAVLLILAIAWTAMRAADLLFDRLLVRLGRERPSAWVFVRPVRTVTRAVIVLVAVLVWFDNVGFDVTTLLAGLGIGGIALALAAQKSLEDVFAAITLLSSRPVSVGDFCRFGDRIGTVEEIGLRWTKVRTLDDTVVTVPNSEFAKQQLENYALRQKIWYHPRLQLRYETTPDQLRYILVEIRKLLYGHPKVLPDPARIRFVGFSDWSLDLDVFAYVDTRVYGEFLEIAEDLNLRIMRIVAEAGSGFALPSQTTYLESPLGLDVERAGAAEARVGEWREKQELYLPRFPESKIADLQGSVPYPPEGSPEAMS